MSDRYVHLFPFKNGWGHRQDNLVTLARHLVLNATGIRAQGGLDFRSDMAGMPLPEDREAGSHRRVPPLACGPAAGLCPEAGENWPAYCQRLFSIHDHKPSMVWLQSPMWQKTDPTPVGAALRIAYLLEYGVPYDHVEIAMGQAYTDYDTNHFLWGKLELQLSDVPVDERPVRWRKQPEWIGAVEHSRRRSAVKADFQIPPGEIPFSAGLSAAQLAVLVETYGPMPSVFHDFLLLSGRRIPAGEMGPYTDRLSEIHQVATNRIRKDGREEDDPVPEDAIFIGLAEGRHPEFILSGERTDSPVFLFNTDTGRVIQTGLSIFTWIEGFMQGAGPPPAAAAVPLVPVEGPTRVGGFGRAVLRVLRGIFR